MLAAVMDHGAAAGGGAAVGDRRAEAVRLLGIAEQLLEERHLERSRTFAERALEAEPLLDGVDRALAAADVLLAAQRCRINDHVEWYAVLQLDAPACARDASAVRLQYRRLALLLRPDHRGRIDRNCSSFFSLSSPSFSSGAADEAFKLVCDAWAVLSDPAKKELYDKEIEIATAAQPRHEDGSAIGRHGGDTPAEKAPAEAEVEPVAAFWTACTSCCYVHQYARGYEGRPLVCQNCREAFQATEMARPPTVAPVGEMYFCAWGLFPLGFPGGPNFAWPIVHDSGKGQKLRHGAAGEPWRQSSFFQGPPSQWGAHGSFPMDQKDGWVNGEVGRAAKRQLRRSSVVKKWPKNGGMEEEEDEEKEDEDSDWSPNKLRKKVVAKRQKKRVASAGEPQVEGSGQEGIGVGSANKGTKVTRRGRKKKVAITEEHRVKASVEEGMSVDPANNDDAEMRMVADGKADWMRNAQKAGSPRTIEVSADDLNLNFTIDVNAAAAIIESMGMSTLTFSKDEDVVVVDHLW